MRHFFIATAIMAALLVMEAFPDRAEAADVGGPPPPAYGPPYTYGPPPAYAPPPGYTLSDEYDQQPGYTQPPAYGPPPGYGPPSAYGPSPRYNSPDDYGPSPGYLADDDGPQSDYGPLLRPPRTIPYAVSPRSFAVRPACDRQWRCGPRGCGWRQVCYPAQPSAEHYARPYRGFADRGYGPPPGPGYYGPN
jgi:hypothetical protein